MNAQVTRLLTRKTALGETRLEQQREEISRAEPEILAQIKSFAITTNNITYAAFGDSMRYWQFFPSGQPKWGQMPVWGFADIVASNVPGLAVGERFYGYFPIASHLRMRPERVTPRGFYDGAGHRKDLTSAYNQYTRCSADPTYAADLESYQMLFRPLFLTSFMLADFLQDNGFFGASQLIVSSASSKTAYGTAFCLQDSEDVDLVGLTSAHHRTFVERLGCYGRVAEYDAISRLAVGSPTLYVDFSGDEALRAPPSTDSSARRSRTTATSARRKTRTSCATRSCPARSRSSSSPRCRSRNATPTGVRRRSIDASTTRSGGFSTGCAIRKTRGSRSSRPEASTRRGS